ncbi:hypothetical protein GUITHDRAFT_151689 [Guillardia theta CCMP2712]|uniref:Uncharacterized protein n=1 Tax=Guillardia theta (strain CCMP2712) TaxID=905079 RepID=L1JJW0_GUITC|nr:hypothetical protein GUITHDRAFT_151689 [Guillardia theta CCMP2712]EKX48798.1 hypothetical protein GUITHDRAFT_151689 [Guillardia theta CCMP2712]|eukprot:XP_005835778.1 hypothetical protein GUITHDRAFT_151689 [Guillardia theta CCMP2712]
MVPKGIREIFVHGSGRDRAVQRNSLELTKDTLNSTSSTRQTARDSALAALKRRR